MYCLKFYFAFACATLITCWVKIQDLLSLWSNSFLLLSNSSRCSLPGNTWSNDLIWYGYVGHFQRTGSSSSSGEACCFTHMFTTWSTSCELHALSSMGERNDEYLTVFFLQQQPLSSYLAQKNNAASFLTHLVYKQIIVYSNRLPMGKSEHVWYNKTSRV